MEVALASRTYPIVFTTGQEPSPVAILGVRKDENLFVSDGKWAPRTYGQDTGRPREPTEGIVDPIVIVSLAHGTLTKFQKNYDSRSNSTLQRIPAGSRWSEFGSASRTPNVPLAASSTRSTTTTLAV